MMKMSIREITQKLHDEEFMETIKTITLIMQDENRLHFAIYFDNLVCMSGFETEINSGIDGYTVDEFHEFLMKLIDIAVNDDIMVFQYVDVELPEAWKKSYAEGGIEPDRWDRRVEFHAFNEPNEMFCIDEIDYMQLTGEIESVPKWKRYMIDWYKGNLITNVRWVKNE